MSERVRPGRFERALPWLVGILGSLLFLRPLRHAPGRTVLDRVFSYDGYVNIGDLGALHRAFSEGPHGRNLLDWIYGAPFFFPQPRPLATSELMPLAGLVTWPFGSEAVLSNNVLIFASCVLNCVGGASFARALGARTRASLVAGVAFAFSAYTNFQSGRVQLLYLFPVAFALGATWRFVRDGRTRDAVIAGAWVLCEALLCLYYTVFLGLSLPLLAIAGRLAFARRGAWQDLARLGAVLAAMLLPIVPLLWPYTQLKSKLGLTRPLLDVNYQSGDAMMFLWSDQATLPGGILKDVYRWDTAYFPGFVVLAGALFLLFSWVKRDWRPRGAIALLVLVPALLSPFITISPLHVALVVATVLLVRLARQGRASPLAPALFALAAVGLFLYGGTAPRAWGRDLGPSAYTWMFLHVPLIDGLRMIRRAGLLVNLALAGLAALAIDRLETKRFGKPGIFVLVALAYVEAMPLELHAIGVPVTCTDAGYRVAHELGIAAVADVAPRDLHHDEMALRRHEAMLCDVATTQGPAGFVPPISEVAADAAATLPSPAAHAWLWEAGIRGVVIRGAEKPDWAHEHMERMKEVSVDIRRAGMDYVVKLAEPRGKTLVPAPTAEGRPLRVTAIECSRGPRCDHAADGNEDTRWTTEALAADGDSVTLHFDEAEVRGLTWHDTHWPWDEPRALEVQRENPDGSWTSWAEFPSLSPIGLASDAVHPWFALPLPPARTKGMRLIHHGKSEKYWLSASEIQPLGAP